MLLQLSPLAQDLSRGLYQQHHILLRPLDSARQRRPRANPVHTYDNGRISPDAIASGCIMRMPPPEITVLLLFSRHHNYIAEHLLDVSESGKYVRDTSKLDEAKRKWQDEDTFQLSRNINVAFLAQYVLMDYISGILNTLRANSE
ncbi:unnamed protein product [Tilletia caries]|uniref:Heme peroxidase n=2 Tax=Tilletia TaxID=13289 RepID=A0ABN7ITK3_9BASI|nr:unnamed protein product [Tilletia caries]CAD6933062.1 unnamed protein product [Tilletia caries]